MSHSNYSMEKNKTKVETERDILYPVKLTIGGAVLSVLKCLLAMGLNSTLHECIHALTGKIVIPGAEFKIDFGFNRAQTKRKGGDPTRIQDQIYIIIRLFHR